ncbi:MAG: TonB-dependent receptor [Caenispirillum sp.]|nr:TonB-dependent receptor [Caenispirillum sp.]
MGTLKGCRTTAGVTALVLAAATAQAAAVAAAEAPVAGIQLAQAETRRFSVPAQPLPAALSAYGAQAGVQVTAAADAIASRTANAVDGEMTPAEALDRLLAGTGAVWSRGPDDTVFVEVPPEVQGSERLDPVTVTASRGSRPLSTIPGSVTVIDRAAIERQARVSRSVGDILSQHVPGYVGPNGLQQENTTIRGRGSLVLLNGVPQNQQLRSAGYDFRNVDPQMIERIEVVRGANATFGFGGTGGIINIITKRPESSEPTFTTRVGTTFAPYELDKDGFTREVYQDVQGRSGPVDYFLGGSYRDLRNAYDAEGDLIPDWNTEYNNDIANVTGNFGYQIDDEQSVRLAASYFRDQEDRSYAPVGGIVGEREADAVPTRQVYPDWLVTGLFFDPQESSNVTLTYDHGDVLGGDMRLETYLQRWTLGYDTALDASPFGGSGLEPGRHEREERRIGLRANFDTPLDRVLPLDGARVTWGGDYLNYFSSELDVFDTRPVDTGFRPDITQDSYAAFAQFEVPLGDLLLSAGVRHEEFRVSVDDMVKDSGRRFVGGDLSYDATLFNLGLVYFLDDRTELFGGYSQGFDITQVGRAASQVDSVAAIDLEPAITDQYEIGLRHAAKQWQTSLSTFYTESELGSRTQASANGIARPLRQPEQIWGIEATLDTQPFDQWAFGGTFTFQEGIRETNGDSRRLQSWYITPVQLTAYAEYEPSAGWFNRLQASYVPDHDRHPGSTSFGEGEVDSVFVLDYVAEVAAGPGTVEIGIRNLLNTQYVPATLQALNDADSYYPAQGTTVSLGYRVTW